MFERLGSDVVDEFFFANGSFTLNKHNYTITDMYRNLGSMQWLQEKYVSKESPDNPKCQHKGENIWKKGHKEPNIMPDMCNFSSDIELEQAGECGYIESCDALKRIGVTVGIQ